MCDVLSQLSSISSQARTLGIDPNIMQMALDAQTKDQEPQHHGQAAVAAGDKSRKRSPIRGNSYTYTYTDSDEEKSKKKLRL